MASKTRSELAEQAASLAGQGRVAQAFALLESGVSKGDALATATLAEWRLTGDFIRRDLAQARDLFGRAAALGLSEAAPIHIALLANGAGGTERGWQHALRLLQELSSSNRLARDQMSVLQQMRIDDQGNPLTKVSRERLSNSPPIERLPGFLSLAECSYVIERAEPLLQPAVVVDELTGRLVRNPVRTSTAASFPFVLEDPVLHALNRRIASATNTAYECGEPLQVLHYAPGQEYKLHSDALPPGTNQRVKTVLVYLNEDYEGGDTAFPDINLAFRGSPGDAIMFENADDSGMPRADARHAGLPVRRGRKLILSKWIREKPIDLSGPPDRPY